MIGYCKRCLTPDTWPDAVFDQEGVCLPCRVAETMEDIDWNERLNELHRIGKWGRDHSHSHYDCIVGVSGGKDSTRQAFYVRDELGLNPLLVCCTYPPEEMTERGAHNLANLAECGFDLHVLSPAPVVSKKLMNYSLHQHGNLFRATELALYATLPQTAISYGIPLIFLGENPSLTFGGKVGSFDSDANNQRSHNTLGGAKVADWLPAGVKISELVPYCYPDEWEFDKADIRIVYLGYFMRDFNDIVNTDFALNHGLEPRIGDDANPEWTGSINPADALDEEFVHINQFFKYLKLGYGKVTQQASVKVRHGQITRDEGIELVRKYDGKCNEIYLDKLANYLDIPRSELDDLIASYRNKDLWHLNNHGEWELKEAIYSHNNAESVW
ncbi:N-acetyl sugar amidotransferase [Thalassospira sp.]|uniref:N-acetyl sugar amidotransferase n=1 Tax=Thalassospira sp. TaxID=1912094 RepID=UPI0032ED0574